ncbi:hypothetical protein HYH03_000190 [Edaphochlamys debaryana]|uniref:PAS domain-containing protein n=1 Tax=Edaphochlamys debaryana TaxID=47281 RepID=A0A836C6Z2_9CHLO|nr:hypothetical protein HYH03_000190 [Edaphochlamys debaryana]|eukprot:KAG2501688.1 hypothetical protein HYH03_000190 [Edaphochlamys debaryana]
MGYTFFLAVLYVFVGLLFINLALSVWVAHSFSQNRFEYVWPIQFLRWFGLIFYQILDIATLTLLLVTLDCNYFGVPEAVQYRNQEFPDIKCWSMPHIIHVAVSVLSIVVFIIMATCMVLSEMELNPLTRNYMAIAHTGVEGMGFGIKTIVTIASVMIATTTKWLSVVYLIFFLLLFYLYVKWVPFTYSTLNYVRCASYGTVLYCSVLLVALSFGPSKGDSAEAESYRDNLTLALWIGMAPAALLGALACHLRLRHFNKGIVGRFRDAEPGTAPKYIHRFVDAREVEITARCCRQWTEGLDDVAEPAAVALSEQIVKAGMMELPTDPRMIILYSSFLIDVQGSYQSGYTQLQTAKKQSPGPLERFAIFSREQEHTQKVSGANGQGAVDLVSYVEFQRNHRLVVKAHREALMAMRSFWGLLLHTNVNFNQLSRALHRIEISVKAAERAYRMVLSRHSSNARLVRLYGRFLETVKFDPWAASKWYTEADRLEEEAEHTKEALQLGGADMVLPSGERAANEMEGVAIICVNAQSIIQVATPEAHALLGYGKNELKGKDLSCIMPPPFGDRHSAYVRNYIQTGVGSVLGKHNQFAVLTKNGSVMPVRLTVSKVSGLNEDSVFMGVLEQLPSSPDEGRCWVLGNGVVVAAEPSWLDWLGYVQEDVAGMQVEDLLAGEDHKENVKAAVAAFASTLRPATTATKPQRTHRRSSMTSTAGADIMAALTTGRRKGSYTSPNGADVSHHHRSAAQVSVEAPPMAPIVLHRAMWRHKYSDPVKLDTFIQPGVFGSVKVHSVVVRRCVSPGMGLAPFGSASPLGGPGLFSSPLPGMHRAPSPYCDMMLVADNRGRILHVTAALAAALGRTPDTLRAGGLDMIIPEPVTQLHGPWIQELGNPQSTEHSLMGAPPPFSCRSGVPVYLSALGGDQGLIVKPFKLEVKQRLAQGGSSKVHIVALNPLTDDQAQAHQRLRLTLDLTGNILTADAATPPELFGADPRGFIGQSIAELVDLFKADTREEASLGAGGKAGGKGGDGDVLEQAGGVLAASGARRITRALLELARRSSENPDSSWRVGVTMPPDDEAQRELAALSLLLGPQDVAAAAQLMGARTVPAVMRVRLVRKTAKPRADSEAYVAADSGPGGGPSARSGGSLWSPVSPHASSRYMSRTATTAAGAGGVDWALPHTASQGNITARPVAEATEPPGEGTILDAADLETLDELVSGASAADLKSKQSSAALSATPTPPAASASASAASLAARVQAMPDRNSSSRDAGRITSLRAASLAPSRAGSQTGSRLQLSSPAPVVAPPPPPSPPKDVASPARQPLPPPSRHGEVVMPPPPQLQLTPAEPRPLSRQASSLMLGGPGDGAARPPPSPSLVSRSAISNTTANTLRLPAPAGGGVTITEAAAAAGAAAFSSSLAASSLVVEVELWRADTLSGVLEVDDRGRIIRADNAGPLNSASLVLGTPMSSLLGSNVTDAFPLLPSGGVESLLDNSHGPGPAVRGALKKRGNKHSKFGLPVVVPGRHASDCCGLDVRVQAVRRAGPLGSAYLILRPSKPTVAQPGFARWLFDNDSSELMPAIAARATAGGVEGETRQVATLTGLLAANKAAKLLSAFSAKLTSNSRAGTMTGLASMELADKVAEAAKAGRSISGTPADIDRGGSKLLTTADLNSPQAPASPFATGSHLQGPAPPPAPPILSLDMAAPRATPARAATDTAIKRNPSRLSQHAAAVAVTAPGFGDGPEGRKQSTDVGMVPSATLDSAYQRGLSDEGLAVGKPKGGGKGSGDGSLFLQQPGEVDDFGGKDGGKVDPVRSWVMGNAVAADPVDEMPHSISGGGSHSGRSSDSGEGDRLSVDVGESSAPANSDGRGADEMESEAGATMANYSVGKRFKKLFKILTSPMAQQPARSLRIHVLVLVAILMIAHVVAFVLLDRKLDQQIDALRDLVSVSDACRRVHEVSINSRLLDTLYSGNSYVEGLPQYGEPVEDAIASTFEDIADVMASLKELHHGVYLGFRTKRRIPVDFGLRSIWDNPDLNMTIYYDAPTINGTTPEPTYQMLGLWDAGNLYLTKTLDLFNNGPTLVAGGWNFSEWSTIKFVYANGVPVIFPAYLDTLDALVQMTVAESESIYTLQLIILCLEGGFLCLAACIYMWIVASSFARKRHSLYNVFVQVPLGVTRGLANMSLQLEPGEEEDEDEAAMPGADAIGGQNLEDAAPPEPTTPAATGKSITIGLPPDKRTASDKGRRIGGLAFASMGKGGKGGGGASFDHGDSHGDNHAQQKEAGNTSGSKMKVAVQGALSSIAFWRRTSKVAPEQQLGGKTRRRLVPSRRLAYLLVAPFLLWGLIIVVINLIGYTKLVSLSAPIATLNVVDVFMVRFHRILYYSMEVASALSFAAVEHFKPFLRHETEMWKTQYTVMLFGSEFVPDANSPHFRLAKTGIVFGGEDRPSTLLYHTNDCMCIDQEDCQPEDSSYYQATRNGLDVLIKHQATALDSLLAQPPEGSGLNSSEWKFLWSTGQTDVEGALNQLKHLYFDDVQSAYKRVQVQQVALFAIAWVWALLFLVLQVRPLLRRASNEMRRIAELLSQLPSEVDVEGLVMAVVLGERATGPPHAAPIVGNKSLRVGRMSDNAMKRK